LKSTIPDDVLRTVAEANERIARISSLDLDALKNIGLDLGTIEAVRSERALLDTLKPEREWFETLKETVRPEREMLEALKETVKPEREWFETLRPTFEAIENAQASWLKLGSEVMPELPNLEIDADLYKRLTIPELTGVSFITGEVETANSVAAELQLMAQVASAARRANYQDIAHAAEDTASDAETEPAELNWDRLFDRLDDLTNTINRMSDSLDSANSTTRIVLIGLVINVIWYLIQIDLAKLGIHP
jgi:hypothetical protein